MPDGTAGRSGSTVDETRKGGRVLRVIFCPKCSWQYGAMWQVKPEYGYWGDCPSCGSVTQVGAHFLPERGTAAAVSVPAQTVLEF
jgi:hypothetical protein